MKIRVSNVVGPYVKLRFVICNLIYIYSATKPAAQLDNLSSLMIEDRMTKKSFKLMQLCTTTIIRKDETLI